MVIWWVILMVWCCCVLKCWRMFLCFGFCLSWCWIWSIWLFVSCWVIFGVRWGFSRSFGWCYLNGVVRCWFLKCCFRFFCVFFCRFWVWWGVYVLVFCLVLCFLSFFLLVVLCWLFVLFVLCWVGRWFVDSFVVLGWGGCVCLFCWWWWIFWNVVGGDICWSFVIVLVVYLGVVLVFDGCGCGICLLGVLVFGSCVVFWSVGLLYWLMVCCEFCGWYGGVSLFCWWVFCLGCVVGRFSVCWVVVGGGCIVVILIGYGCWYWFLDGGLLVVVCWIVFWFLGLVWLGCCSCVGFGWRFWGWVLLGFGKFFFNCVLGLVFVICWILLVGVLGWGFWWWFGSLGWCSGWWSVLCVGFVGDFWWMLGKCGVVGVFWGLFGCCRDLLYGFVCFWLWCWWLGYGELGFFLGLFWGWYGRWSCCSCVCFFVWCVLGCIFCCFVDEGRLGSWCLLGGSCGLVFCCCWYWLLFSWYWWLDGWEGDCVWCCWFCKFVWEFFVW